jgi:hypothetical protein
MEVKFTVSGPAGGASGIILIPNDPRFTTLVQSGISIIKVIMERVAI